MKHGTNSKWKLSKYALLLLMVLSNDCIGQTNSCTLTSLSLNWSQNYRNRFDLTTPDLVPIQNGTGEIISGFENAAQYKQHVNTIFARMRGRSVRPTMSIRKHLSIAVIVTDSDDNVDNCNKEYITLVAVKKGDNTVDTQSFTADSNHLLFKHIYAIGFYIGEHITDFQFTIKQDRPATYWGTQLATDNETYSLTGPDMYADKGEFFLLNTYLQGKLRYLEIRAK